MSATSQADAPRLLALVSQGRSSVQIEYAVEDVKKRVRELVGREPCVMDSATWYRDHFRHCGDWDSWVWETVTGKDYSTRQLRFAGFVVCTPTLGRATAKIVDLALRNNRPVLAWKEQEPLTQVTRLVELDGSDWKAGWTVDTRPVGG